LLAIRSRFCWPNQWEREGTSRVVSGGIVSSGGLDDPRLHDVRVKENGMSAHEKKHWYTTEELAELLKVDASSIRRWRTAQPLQGPPFVRVSARRTIYSAADVEAWLDHRRVDPSAVA
jgi:hypothetical protein